MVLIELIQLLALNTTCVSNEVLNHVTFEALGAQPSVCVQIHLACQSFVFKNMIAQLHVWLCRHSLIINSNNAKISKIQSKLCADPKHDVYVTYRSH